MSATTTFLEISREGTIALPRETRDRLGVREGGEVAVIEHGDSLLITTRRALVAHALDRLGEGLPDDLTLEDLIESGRELREEIIFELYGLRPEDVER